MKQSKREAPQRGTASGQRDSRYRHQSTGHHRCPPHLGCGELRGLRDGVQHHPFQRALPQLADQQPNQKLLLAHGGVSKQLGEQLFAHRERAAAAGSRDALQRVVDLTDG